MNATLCLPGGSWIENGVERPVSAPSIAIFAFGMLDTARVPLSASTFVLGSTFTVFGSVLGSTFTVFVSVLGSTFTVVGSVLGSTFGSVFAFFGSAFGSTLGSVFSAFGAAFVSVCLAVVPVF